MSTANGTPRGKPMISDQEQIRAAIGKQAAEWFVANDEAPLDARGAAALMDWLKASPMHVRELLGVALTVRDLHELGSRTEYAPEALLEFTQADFDGTLQPIRRRIGSFLANLRPSAGLAMVTLATLAVGLVFFTKISPHLAPAEQAGSIVPVTYASRHGEQQTVHLPDKSILHLNTDSAATVRFSRTDRLVLLTSGEAEFEVVHESARAFRVLAGATEIVAVGTRFDVRLERGSTAVTVLEGRVAAGPAQAPKGRNANARAQDRTQFVELSAGQQLRVENGEWPAAPVRVDAEQTTAWLHRQIVFKNESLANVAAELNRYAGKPIEITTPALRDVRISGTFTIDNPEAFIAFLRSLDGVRVEVTPTRIRVSQK